MKVELVGSWKKALLERYMWMGEGEGSPEGGQDEASQQRTLLHLQWSVAKARDTEFSKLPCL